LGARHILGPGLAIAIARRILNRLDRTWGLRR
jgi:hypothetical protein